MALPIPMLEPVMTATCPSRRSSMVPPYGILRDVRESLTVRSGASKADADVAANILHPACSGQPPLGKQIGGTRGGHAFLLTDANELCHGLEDAVDVLPGALRVESARLQAVGVEDGATCVDDVVRRIEDSALLEPIPVLNAPKLVVGAPGDHLAP